ncbi:transcriptional regulator [Macellibacteroides sp. HH-ZS]|nr:transcriptional regulator [Macellibacteroides sp. HH-ZS]
MLFTDKIKELRISNQLPQRKLAAALDIDTATYCKIEKGERKARKEQVKVLASLFNIESEELLTLWLADRVSDIIIDNKSVAIDVLSIVAKNIHEKKKYE